MKNGIFLFFLLVTHISSSFSQTNIPSGDVSGTWTFLNSPYYIDRDITIPDDSTLIIEPGVLVEFQGHYALNVQGRLLAIGNENNNITFTINDTTGFFNPDTTLGGWYGIRFIDTPVQNDTSKIIYCKLQYGKAVGQDWFFNAGGAMCILHFDKVIISNCYITNCSAGGSGFAVGGALAVGWSDIQLIDNVISYNNADAGGAIHFYESDPILINNRIEYNSAVDGGALDLQTKSHSIISNNQITNNYSSRNGGAINIGGDSVTAVFSETIISKNSASDFGGAINAWDCNLEFNYCSVDSNSSSINGGGINAENCNLIINNTYFRVDTTTLSGGAIAVNNSELNLDNCNITDNGAGVRGGGIFSNYSIIDIVNTTFERDTITVFGAAIQVNYSDLSLDNCNLIENRAGNFGGGIHSEYSDVNITNTAFEGDTSGNAGGGISLWQSNLGVAGCTFTNNFAIYSGGAIYSDSSLVNLDNTSFTQNSAIDNGGAIFLSRSNALMNNNSFEQNTSVWGGGILSGYSGLNLRHCSFTQNASEHGGAVNVGFGTSEMHNISFVENSSIWGGGITASNCDLLVDSCSFYKNSVTNEAGGIECIIDTSNYSKQLFIQIINSEFIENTSDNLFAGVEIKQLYSDTALCNVLMDKNLFKDNTANSYSAIRFIGNIDNIIVNNSIFDNNYNYSPIYHSIFSANGGAKVKVNNSIFANNYPRAASLNINARIDFMNCTFANNYGTNSAALSLRNNAEATITNSILWNNGNNPILLVNVGTSASFLTVNYSDIQFGLDSLIVPDSLSVLNWGVGNLDSDPLFADTLNKDYHLQDLSPCIAAGIDSIEIAGFWQYSPSTDIEGNTRPFPTGTMPDMGAYESQYPVRVEEQNSNLPISYALYQNYPNPFNNSTVIKYSILKEGFVTLKIYNAIGEEVTTIVNEVKRSGNYDVTFNTAQLTSGVYFYRLQAGSFVETKKMILLK